MELKNPKKSTKQFILDEKSPIVQNLVLATLRAGGVEIYHNSTEFNPAYPRILWAGEHVTQTKTTSGLDDKYDYLTLDDFMAKFTESRREMKVGDYDAVISKEIAKVGCQNIPFAVVEKVYNTMVELRAN
jgi:hypothetical protein